MSRGEQALGMEAAAPTHIVLGVVGQGSVWSHGVDGDAVLADLLGEDARERVHAALRGRVHGEHRVADESRGRADVDDSPMRPFDHPGQDGVAAVQRGREVQGDVGRPRLRRGVDERVDVDVAADVVDQHVDGAEAIERRRDHAVDLHAVGDVGRLPARVLGAACEQPLADARAGFLVAADDDDIAALGREGNGDPAADVGRRAGDDHRASAEPSLHVRLPLGSRQHGS